MKDLPKLFFLIGYMGSGKTTVGKILAAQIQYEYIDMDVKIEEMERMPIRRIFAVRGEQYFRSRETALLERLCSRENIVVSCGGGIIRDQRNVTELKKNGVTVFLKTKVLTSFERVKNDANRPLAFLEERDEQAQFSKFQALYYEREESYNNASDFCIETDENIPEEVAGKILCKVKELKQ